MSGDSRLSLDVELLGGVARVVVAGELDPHSSPQLHEAWQAALADLAGSAPTLELDLAGVTFMDSSGVRELVVANRAVRDRAGRLVIRRPSDTVRRLLEITQLLTELDVDD